MAGGPGDGPGGPEEPEEPGPPDGMRREEGSDSGRVGRRYYDRSEYFGDRSRHLKNLSSPFQRYRVEKVLEIHRPGKEARVLDLGCGWGTITVALAPWVRWVVAVDFSRRALEFCRQQVRVRGAKNVSFLLADAARTGLADEFFDVVYAADLLEHLYPAQTASVLDECARVLKRGGRLVIWTPHEGHVLEALRRRKLLRQDPTHVDYKSMEEIRRALLEREFSVEKAYYAESHVPILREVERSLMASVPQLRRRIAVLARKR